MKAYSSLKNQSTWGCDKLQMDNRKIIEDMIWKHREQVMASKGITHFSYLFQLIGRKEPLKNKYVIWLLKM